MCACAFARAHLRVHGRTGARMGARGHVRLYGCVLVRAHARALGTDFQISIFQFFDFQFESKIIFSFLFFLFFVSVILLIRAVAVCVTGTTFYFFVSSLINEMKSILLFNMVLPISLVHHNRGIEEVRLFFGYILLLFIPK